jgi:hypothetical protein
MSGRMGKKRFGRGDYSHLSKGNWKRPRDGSEWDVLSDSDEAKRYRRMGERVDFKEIQPGTDKSNGREKVA